MAPDCWYSKRHGPKIWVVGLDPGMQQWSMWDRNGKVMRVFDFSEPALPAALLARVLATALLEPPLEQEATVAVCHALGASWGRVDPAVVVAVPPGTN